MFMTSSSCVPVINKLGRSATVSWVGETILLCEMLTFCCILFINVPKVNPRLVIY
jgi:hypothetical protein